MATVNELVQLVPAQGTINGLFDQIQPIGPNGGGGHFSAVFKANHIPLARPAALKFLVDNGDVYRQLCFVREGELLDTVLRGDPLFVQLVERPSTLQVQVQIPNVGPQTWAYPFLAFEWLPKGDIESKCAAAKDGADLLDKLDLFRKMCRCVRRLHRYGCFHRDLKPGNFFLARHRAVKLGDFGTTRLLAPNVPSLLPHYPAPPGDLRYTAPELLAGLDVNKTLLASADIYSLGAILFEMLTGQLLVSFHLGPLVPAFLQWMQQVSPAQRQTYLHGFLDGQGPRVPDLRQANPNLPKCSYEPLRVLLEGVANFDYRERLRSFDEIDRLAKISILVTANERAYLKMLDRRRARRRGPHNV